MRQLPSRQLKSRFWPVDLLQEDAERIPGNFLENNMNVKLSIVLVACMALFVSACGSRPQNLILGKWEIAGANVGGADVGSAAEVGKAIKMTAEFNPDGTAKMTIMGQTLQGTYKVNGGNELEWTMSGITTKSKLNVTATELEVTDDANRTIKYKRK
jgi:hypothetical protein